MTVTIAQTIDVPEWNAEVQQKSSAFWTKHGMTMSQDEHSLSGRRGSLFSVLLSTKPTAIGSRLTITSMDPTKIDCVLKCSTAFQWWCIWDKTAFELELSLFDHFLKTGDSKDQHWQCFVEEYQKHYWMANLSGGLMGLTMSQQEQQRFRTEIEINYQR